MKLRIATTAVFGIALGTWAYLDMLGSELSQETYDLTHGELIVPGLMLLAVLTGFVARRSWVLLALLGPVASLGYLQTTGHRGSDGIDPLTSAPSIAFLFWFALLLLIGVGASRVWNDPLSRRRHTPSA